MFDFIGTKVVKEQSFMSSTVHQLMKNKEYSDFCCEVIIRKGCKFSVCKYINTYVVCAGEDRSAKIYQSVKIFFELLNILKGVTIDAFT